MSNSHTYWEAAFLKGPNSRKQASIRPPGGPRPKSVQFCQQLTYWEGVFDYIAFLQLTYWEASVLTRVPAACSITYIPCASLFRVAIHTYCCRLGSCCSGVLDGASLHIHTYIHIGKPLFCWGPIPEKRVPKGPWLPQAKK